ncbi:MAG: S41 family peptidase, partial [Segetibacter sp.]
VLSCTNLTQYLVQKPFHVADTVAAFTRKFPYKKYIKPWFIYWLSMRLTGRRYSDDRIHFRFFENHSFKPKKNNHFDGNIYLMTGGYTFSAATLVTVKLKGQSNVTIVGEETGGGAYGNSAMFLTTIVLPTTKLRVTLPLYRMVWDAKHPKNGRGVFPDVEVRPTSTFIKEGVDAKLEKVKELIRETKKTNVFVR